MNDEKLMVEREHDGLKVVIKSPSTGILTYYFSNRATMEEYLARCEKHNIAVLEGKK